jgi:hypothetical protein
MRGADGRSGALFSYVDLEVRVPHGHPLRTIRLIVNEALAGLSPDFHDLYARVGRPSIPRSSCCGRSCCKRSTRSALG